MKRTQGSWDPARRGMYFMAGALNTNTDLSDMARFHPRHKAPASTVVAVTAEHSCMCIRGAHATGETTTTAVDTHQDLLYRLTLDQHARS